MRLARPGLVLALASFAVPGVLACAPKPNGTDDRAELSALRDEIVGLRNDVAELRAEVEALRPIAERARAEEARRREREERRAEARARRAELGGRRPGIGDGDDPRPGRIEIPDGAIACASETECSIDRAFAASLLAEPERLARQARIIPNMRDGAANGFKIYGIRRSSVLGALNLQNGDVLLSINGTRLDSVNDAMMAYIEVADADRFELELQRRGAPVSLTIRIVD